MHPATSLWHCNLSEESDQGMSQELGIIGAEQYYKGYPQANVLIGLC